MSEVEQQPPLPATEQMSLEFALKIADSHASISDVLEYRALSVLASAVRAAQIHTVDHCGSDGSGNQSAGATAPVLQGCSDSWGDDDND